MYWKRYGRRKQSLPNHAVLPQNTPGDTVKNQDNHSAVNFEVTLQITPILIHCNSTQTKPCPCMQHVLTERSFFMYRTICICLPSDGQWLKYITATYGTRVLASKCFQFFSITLILRRSRTGTVWFYTSTNKKRAARPKLYTKSLTRDLKLMYVYSRLTLVRISINL